MVISKLMWGVRVSFVCTRDAIRTIKYGYMNNENKKNLTSVSGRRINENENVLTAGPRGPMLLQDFWFLEKLAHFDREVIPERRMHAKGSGAYGTFKVTHDITKYT